MRILLVEDEPNAARMLAKGLREEAYAVDVSGDGERAFELAQVNDLDLIILDVVLPRKVDSPSHGICAPRTPPFR